MVLVALITTPSSASNSIEEGSEREHEEGRQTKWGRKKNKQRRRENKQRGRERIGITILRMTSHYGVRS